MEHLIRPQPSDASERPSPLPDRFPFLAVGSGGNDLTRLAELFELVGQPLAAPCLIQTCSSAGEIEELISIIRSRCAMPACLAYDNRPFPVEGICIAPTSKQLRFSRGSLRLSDAGKYEPVLDRFFASVASTLGPAARCVLVDPEGTDGEVGLHLVTRSGGQAFMATGFSASGRRAIGPWVEVVALKAIAKQLREFRQDQPTTYVRMAAS